MDVYTGIYRIVCEATGKFYLGSSQNVRRRWSGHLFRLRHGIHQNPRLQNAWNKYGEDSFSFRMLEHCPVEQLTEREQYWIDLTDPVQHGYNCRRLAESNRGFCHTQETRDKMSKAAKGKPKPPRSEVHNQRQSMAMKGKPRKPLSEEHKQNLRKPKSKKRIYRHLSEEHKQKLRKPKSEEHKQNMRKPKSEEHKQNMRKAMSEERKQKLRKPKSEEHKQKLREAYWRRAALALQT